MLASCVNHTSKSGNNTVGADTSKQFSSVHHGGLMDSIRDPRLLALVNEDSVELLAVNHTMSDTFHLEQVVFMDYHHYMPQSPDSSYKELRRESDSLFKPITVINPLPDLRGSYLSVFLYKGRFVTSHISEDPGTSTSNVVITDSAMLWFFMMPYMMLYDTAFKTSNRITFIASFSPENTDTIEIKKLHGDLDLQVWKWHSRGRIDYSLRIPPGTYVPDLIEANNVGVEAGPPIQLDPINYDSLFNMR
jgi:hypothetical protein